MSQDEILAEWEKLQENEEGYLEIGELWDGLHCLMTGKTTSEIEDGNTLSESITGTETFGTEDFIAYILSEKVLLISDALQDFDIDSAIETFDPEVFAQKDVYPNIWEDEDIEDLQEELNENFCALKDFYKKAAEMGKGVIVGIY